MVAMPLEWLIPTVVVAILITVVITIIALYAERKKLAAMSPAERERYLAEQQERQLTYQWGPLSPTLVCPHCQTKGKVRTKGIVQEKEIIGGDVASPGLFGRLPLLSFGLSRKVDATQAYCGNCNNTWVFSSSGPWWRFW